MKKSKFNIKKINFKKIDKKYALLMSVLGIALVIVGVLIVTKTAGCGKKDDVPILTYATVEDSEDNIYITGLTDKGKFEEDIYIPEKINGKKVVSVGREAFRDAQNLKTVTIAEGIEQISENAFFNCKKLSDISIPTTVSYIGTNAFMNTLWESKALETSDYIVVNSMLVDVKEGKNTYSVPAGVTKISSGVFYNNKEVVKVELPQSLEVVGDYAFAGCTALESVELPLNVKEIGYSAFNGCESLVLEVPDSAQKVGIDAFLGVKEVK